MMIATENNAADVMDGISAMHPQRRRKYSVIITLWECESLF